MGINVALICIFTLNLLTAESLVEVEHDQNIILETSFHQEEILNRIHAETVTQGSDQLMGGVSRTGEVEPESRLKFNKENVRGSEFVDLHPEIVILGSHESNVGVSGTREVEPESRFKFNKENVNGSDFVDLHAKTMIQDSDKTKLDVSGTGEVETDSWLKFNMEKLNRRDLVDSRDDNVPLMKKTIKAVVINHISTDEIRVRCEARNNFDLIQDFSYVYVKPRSEYTWIVEQLDYSPNILICYFTWGENYLSYYLYRDSPQHNRDPQSFWLINREGLSGFVGKDNFVLVKPWNHCRDA